MRHLTALLTTLCATATLSMSACLIVVDDEETHWSPPPTTCSYVCDDYGCWETCYDQTWCVADSECDLGLYCEGDPASYYYGQCVTSPAGLCSADGSCGLEGYVCDERDTCVPGEAAPPLVCEDLTSEAACLEADACAPVYTGVNCTTPSGAACSAQAADCTCESFVFARCEQPITP